MYDKRGTMTYVTDTKNCGFRCSPSALLAGFKSHVPVLAPLHRNAGTGFWDKLDTPKSSTRPAKARRIGTDEKGCSVEDVAILILYVHFR
jgi:hypothetical protein